MIGRYPECVLLPDGEGNWVLYADKSCQEVVAFFPEKEDGEYAQQFFSGNRSI